MIYVYRGPHWAPPLRWGLNIWRAGATITPSDGITRPCAPGVTYTLHLGRFQILLYWLQPWEFNDTRHRLLIIRWWGPVVSDDDTPRWEYIKQWA